MRARTERSGGEREAARSGGSASRPRKALTIGAVAKILSQEFDDISISKIRYLEDQKLLAPRRTAGGYRLYSQADVERLRAILRMQRDEFLPLRVIRQELADRRLHQAARRRAEAAAARRAIVGRAPRVDASPRRSCSTRPASPRRFLRELQEFGIVQPDRRDGRGRSTTRPTSRSSARRPSSRGSASAGRNLRVFRTSADREAALLEQIVGAVAALAQPGAAQGGGREPREPRRHLRPPQAPAAGEGSAPAEGR